MLFTFVQHYMPLKSTVTEDMNEQCNELHVLDVTLPKPHVSMRELTKCKKSLHSPAPIGTISLNSTNISADIFALTRLIVIIIITIIIIHFI